MNPSEGRRLGDNERYGLIATVIETPLSAPTLSEVRWRPQHQLTSEYAMKLKTFVYLSLITLIASFCQAANARRPRPADDGCTKSVSHKAFVDWPQFHFDACHAGYNPYEAVLSPANVGNLVLAWQAGPQKISSSPVIANGVLYYGTANNGAVYALDARTGRGLWGATTITDGAAGTPAVAGGKLYVSVMTEVGGSIFAFDAADGNPLWSGNEGGFPSGVTVGDGAVYVIAGYQGLPPHQELYALDALTGGFLWGYIITPISSDFVATIAGELAYAPCQPGLCAWDANTGMLKWNYSPPESLGFETPAVSNGVVYVGASRGAYGYSYSTNMYALDATTGALLWQGPITGTPFTAETLPYRGSPAVANGVLYVATYEPNFHANEPNAPNYGYMYAIDATTGARLWRFQTSAPIESAAAVANGVVYFGSDDTNIYALDARTGAVLWKYATTGPVIWPPAVVNGMLYASDGTYMYAFHLPNQ